MSQVLDAAFLVACAVVWAAAISFVGRYAMHTWWRTAEGKNLMYMSLCVAAIFGWLPVRVFLDVPHEVRTGIDLLITLGVLVVGLGRHRLLTDADRDAASKEGQP